MEKLSVTELIMILISRYWNLNDYKMLLNSKKMWDPYDIFNHCHSVGSIADDCCPKDA